MMHPGVDDYLAEGCGRCSHYRTPQCKVHTWVKELRELRRIVLACGLTEEVKWSVPCYTHKEANVCMVSAFKDYCFVSFFKGSLLQDPDGLLHRPGESSQAARLFKFTDVREVIRQEATVKAFVFEAIEIEKAGLKVAFKKNLEPLPEELLAIFDENTELKAAFEALTPGRQRGYIIHFSQPKQSQTRTSRIQKCIPKIMAGKGFMDR